jgi:hypothetical protein
MYHLKKINLEKNTSRATGTKLAKGNLVWIILYSNHLPWGHFPKGVALLELLVFNDTIVNWSFITISLSVKKLNFIFEICINVQVRQIILKER